MLMAMAELTVLVSAALERAGAAAAAAASAAQSMVRAEGEGNKVCGIVYAPIFCDHLISGKVDGRAVPRFLSQDGAAIRVDAAHGLAQPAFDLGLPALASAARRHGVAALSVAHSYNALALGHPVSALAEQGLIALAFANAPASMAMPGLATKLFGTNPLAFACPDSGQGMIVVDQAMSATTKTEISLRAKAGRDLPDGWAQDAMGRPTNDARAALDGSLVASGGQKGANIALVIDVLAAALTGSSLSIDASPLGRPEGGPPDVGQFFIALDPAAFAGPAVLPALSRLASAIIGTGGGRLPGASRQARLAESLRLGIDVDDELLADLHQRAGRPQ